MAKKKKTKAAKSKKKPARKAVKKLAKKKAPRVAAKKAKKPLKKTPAKKQNVVQAVKPKPAIEANPIAKIQPKPKGYKEDNRLRYSDEELAEFKELILGKIEEAQRDLELLRSSLSHKDDHGTDDTSPTFKLLEDGSDVLSKEETAQLAARQEKYIQALLNALIRIENKTYGICRVTGKLIPKERLRSVPHATLSIDAKLAQSI